MSTPGLLHRILLYVTSFLGFLVRPLRSKGSGIPSIGPSAPVLSILGAFRFFSDAQGVITEGYTKYKHDIFKIAQLDHWLYIACDKRIAEEVNEAPEEVLSLTEAMDEVFQTKYTIRVAMRDCIARSRPSLLRRPYPTELAQDCRRTLEELLSAEDATTEWKQLPIYHIIEDVLHRVGNLFFLGETFYKNEEYIELNKTYTTRILEAAVYYHVIPRFLRPMFSKFYDPLAPLIERASQLLQPEFQSREEKSKEYGKDWPGRDDDMLATLMEFGNDMFNDKRTLVISLLTVNVATVHSTSQSFMHALYRIAGNPEYAEALREEIREITEKDGWNTDALSKMRKLDSFLRESLRMCSVTALVLSKLAKQDFKLSDGRIIPKGSVIATPATAIHWDGDLYEDPGVFKPWRFLTDDKNEGRVLQNTATDASPEFLAFANGEHACPGRFFAVVTIKACLAHILLTYDVKFEKEGTDPKPVWFVTACRPDPSVRVLFKRRVGVNLGGF